MLALVVAVASAHADGAEPDIRMINELCGTYFAPVSLLPFWRMRTPSGGIREFRINNDGRGTSVDGWKALVEGKKAVLTSPRGREHDGIALELEYGTGTLTRVKLGGRNVRIRYPEPVTYEGEEIVPLWEDVDAETRAKAINDSDMWKNDGRFKLFFRGPNQAAAFVSFLLLAAAGLAMGSRRPFAIVAFSSLALAFLVMLALTASRGGFVATAAGLAAEFACIGRARGWLKCKCIVAVVLAGILVLGVALATAYVSKRSARGDVISNSTRVELWSCVPRMVHDAPCGWGGRIASGLAYIDWYNKDGKWLGRFNLISDHLTAIVAYGWVLGGLYIFCWAAGILLLLRLAWNGLSAIPAAIWISFAVAAFFNVVWPDKTLQACAFASLAFLLPGIRRARPSWLAAPAVAGAVVSVSTMTALVAVGGCRCDDDVSVHFDGKRVVLNGDNPKVFIVDDGETLGGASTPNEMRMAYKIWRSAEAVCYLKSIDDVPWSKVGRLVLAGAAGREFIERLDECGEDGGSAFPLPREIVFLSPQFPPSAIPDGLREKSAVRVVIGEFAARYWKEYVNPPEWVTIVRGAEVYIPGWMSYCIKLERRTGGS